MIALASVLWLLGAAQATPSAEGVAVEPTLTVRISTEIVQLDAVVTDRQGRPVAGLGAQDFEIKEDGRAQALSHAVLVDNAASVAPASTGAGASVPAAVSTRRDGPGRTFVLVVDDFNHTFETTACVRDAVGRFVRETLAEGDVAAVVLTSEGPSAVPQFTADKQALLARTSAVVWGRGWLGAPRSPLDPTERLLADPIPGQPFTFWGGRPPQGTFARDVLRRDGRGRLEYEQRTAAFTRGSLGTVNGVINRLLDRRGRTALVFFSDGVPLVRPEVEQANVWDALRRLVDQANRASVVLYTVDARGVVSGGVTAEDTLRSGETPQALAQVGVGRRYEVLESQEPLRYLAAETGGLFLSSNDLADAIGRVALDQSAYYLLGYTPSLATFQPGGDGPRYRKVQIKVKRPGLQVRSRKGFFGISDPLPNSLPAPERDPVRAASR